VLDEFQSDEKKLQDEIDSLKAQLNEAETN